MNSVSKFLNSLLLIALLVSCSGKDELLPVVGVLQWQRLELSNELNETITKISVQEGQHVSAGDEILRFDASRIQADIDNAQALVAQSQSQLNELINGARPEEIQQARAAVAQSKSASELAGVELQRVQLLIKKKLISPDELDKASAQLKSSIAQLDLHQAQLALLLKGSRKEKIEQAKQNVAASIARLKKLQINLQRSVVRAPQNGIIDELPFRLGEKPQANSVVAVMLVGEQPYAEVYVPEPIRVHIKIGTRASIEVDGLNNVFDARVGSISHDPVFTPYYSLTEGDRSRLAYRAKVYFTEPSAIDLVAGIPLQVKFIYKAEASTTSVTP